jgi:small-conductance mechanosensitive channel
MALQADKKVIVYGAFGDNPNDTGSYVDSAGELVEKTLKVGDFVDLESGVRGTVTEIAMRYTRVTTNDAVDVLVPNSEFINGRVTNWTFGDRFRRIRIGFGVAY